VQGTYKYNVFCVLHILLVQQIKRERERIDLKSWFSPVFSFLIYMEHFLYGGKRDGLQKLSKSDSGCLINFSSPPPKGKPQKKWWEKGARPFLLFSAKGVFLEKRITSYMHVNCIQ